MKESLEVKVAKLEIKVDAVKDDTHYLRAHFFAFTEKFNDKLNEIDKRVAGTAALVGLVVSVVTAVAVTALKAYFGKG